MPCDGRASAGLRPAVRRALRVAAARAARCSPSVLHFFVPVVTGCRDLVG
uniref:Uncharacterized protein n=1 Tax=Fagus sylvatica TaxID=28930 RepID=A0A2N9H9H0_FAGSY